MSRRKRQLDLPPIGVKQYAGPTHQLFDPYVNKAPRPRVYFEPGSSLTQQQFKDECDINKIVANYVRTGEIPLSALNKRAAMYADVSAVGDLMDALETVQAAREGFATLPAKVRDRFANDPAQLLAFLADPRNAEESATLGLSLRPDGTSGPPAAPKTPETTVQATVSGPSISSANEGPRQTASGAVPTGPLPPSGQPGTSGA